jgi:hypothetical protein
VKVRAVAVKSRKSCAGCVGPQTVHFSSVIRDWTGTIPCCGLDKSSDQWLHGLGAVAVQSCISEIIRYDEII